MLHLKKDKLKKDTTHTIRLITNMVPRDQEKNKEWI